MVREGAGAKGCPRRVWCGVRAQAPFQPSQVRRQGLISISDQLFGLPEAWAGCGRGTGTGMGWLPSWTGLR